MPNKCQRVGIGDELAYTFMCSEAEMNRFIIACNGQKPFAVLRNLMRSYADNTEGVTE